DEIYFVVITYGIPALTILWLISFWPNLQNAFAIPIGGVLLCSIFVLRGYINTGSLPFTNKVGWEAYWPIIFLAITIFILSAVFYKQKKWDERLSKKIISLISIIIILLMTPLVFLMSIGKISSDDISTMVRHNRVAHLSATVKIKYFERDLGVDYILNKLKRINRDANNSSVTQENANTIADSAEIAVTKAEKAKKIYFSKSLKKQSIEKLIFSESISLYREYEKKISMLVVRLQL
ncbi:hypothetical protein K8R61_00135, partial [bacterium]|nr:hypothetical protein [bacterium]